MDNIVANISQLIDLDIEKVEQDMLNSREMHGMMAKKFFQFTYISLALICISINISMAVVKYKALHKEKHDIIILNFIVMNCLLLMALLTDTSCELLYCSRDLLCILDQLQIVILLGSILLMMLLTAHWYVKLYYPVTYQKFSVNFNLIITSIYLFSILWLGLGVYSCYNPRMYSVSEKVLILCVSIIYIIFKVFINFQHFLKKKKLADNKNLINVCVLLTNTYFFTQLLLLTYFLIKLTGTRDNIYFEGISIIIVILIPLYFFIILYKYDRDFYKSLTMILSCNKYGGDPREEAVLYNDENVKFVENES